MSDAPTGIDQKLEALANLLLADDRRGITVLSEKKFWLTEEQWARRYQHEVLVPDAALLRGLYDCSRIPEGLKRGYRTVRVETETDDPTAEPTEFVMNGSPPPEPPEEPERWAPLRVPGTEGYSISTLAHVRNSSGQLLSPYQPGRNKSVVPWVSLNHKAFRLDKLVLETFVGPPKSWRYGPRHLNGQQPDCRLENLEWEFGLGRKPQGMTAGTTSSLPKPRGRPRGATKAASKSKPPTTPVSSDVQERVFLESGNITLMWDRTQRKVDVSQLPSSSPIIDEADLPSLAKCIQHIIDSRSVTS